MRLVLIAVGSRGDIQPYIPLAVGLQAAGHAVCIATHQPYESFVRRYGLDFHPIPGDPQAMMQGEGGLSWLETGRNPVTFLQRMRDLAMTLMQGLGESTLAAAQGADGILFSLLGFFPGASLAEKLNIPALGVYLQPVHRTGAFAGILFPELPENTPLRAAYNLLTHDAIMEMNWWLFKESYNVMRTQTFNLPPETTSFRILMNNPYPVLYGYSPHVIPRPADWGPSVDVTGYWFLDDPEWQPDNDLLAFLDAGPKPVYVGFGSMTHRDAERMTGIALEAIQKSGQRAVLLSGWAGIGNGDLPDTIYKLDYAPHGWLFPRMAAVAHHGGAGTTGAGLRAGVPAVVVPHFADQPFWGRQVRTLGVGPDSIPQQQLTADKLAYALRVAATNEGMQQRAAALGAKIRAEEGVATAVQCVQAVLTRHPAGLTRV